MDIDKVLKETFGFSDFRQGQRGIVELILQRRNLLAVFPTGAGKSLCYQLPAVIMSGRTIVVSPLIALMKDQVAYLKSLQIPADAYHSQNSMNENQKVWQTFINGKTKILYISPERLMKENVLLKLKKLPLEMFVIDEAHCISKWGAGFRTEYEQLSQLKQNFPRAILVAFTATADKATRADIVKKLTHSEPELVDENPEANELNSTGFEEYSSSYKEGLKQKTKVIVRGFDRPNLFLSVLPKEGWRKKLLDFLAKRKGQSGIIYPLSRRETESLAEFLQQEGYHALSFHAGQAAQVKKDSQDRFMTEEACIMVATIAFGMGIDKPDIRFVVHTHLPSSVEAFYQEIGRAGRDMAPADTLLFYGLKDLITRREMIQNGNEDQDFKIRELKRLDALIAYCETAGCRRKALLSYFGEIFDNCGNCDNCLNPPKVEDRTREAQIILSAIVRTGEFFGSAHIIDVVRGVESAKVKMRRHNKLPTFGKGSDYPKKFWHNLLRQLVALGELEVDIERFGALKVTGSGRELLKSKKAFFCKDPLEPSSGESSLSKVGVVEKNKEQIQIQDIELLKQLKQLRLEIARKDNVPAFIVFSDRTLIEMANEKPTSKQELLRITGVGPHKLKLYGEAFLNLMPASSD